MSHFISRALTRSSRSLLSSTRNLSKSSSLLSLSHNCYHYIRPSLIPNHQSMSSFFIQSENVMIPSTNFHTNSAPTVDPRITLIQSLSQMRTLCSEWASSKKSVGFVPTMVSFITNNYKFIILNSHITYSV
jgi:hypothetical protein